MVTRKDADISTLCRFKRTDGNFRVNQRHNPRQSASTTLLYHNKVK